MLAGVVVDGHGADDVARGVADDDTGLGGVLGERVGEAGLAVGQLDGVAGQFDLVASAIIELAPSDLMIWSSFWLPTMACSTEENWLSWLTNWVASSGANGSWNLSWAVSSVRNEL